MAENANGSGECGSLGATEASSAVEEPQQQQQHHQPSLAAAAAQESEHPFETDPGDHAETPFEAYQHLDLLLTRLAKRLGTTKSALRVYDPYFCEGRMVQHMAQLGFESVYNKNEDFYEVKAAGQCPEFDVLVTNPPFSGDHLERIFRFAVKSNKPWCLLVPQYVARKAFFLEWLNNQRPKGVPKPSFLAPTQQPYVFTAPNRSDVREMRLPSQPAAPASSNSTGAAGADNTAAAAAATATSLSALSLEDNNRAQPADTSQTAAAPVAAGAEGSIPGLPKAFDVAAGSFQCVWFFSLGECHHKPVFEWLQQQLQQQQGRADGGGAALAADDAAGPAGFTVVATVKEVPQLTAAPKLTPAERRWRKKMAAAGGQPADGEQSASNSMPQQQQQQGGRAASGRPGSGRQHQQQQQQSSGGRRGGRVPTARHPLVGRSSGGRFGAGASVAPQQPSVGGRPAAGRQQQQQQQQQPAARACAPQQQ